MSVLSKPFLQRVSIPWICQPLSLDSVKSNRKPTSLVKIGSDPFGSRPYIFSCSRIAVLSTTRQLGLKPTSMRSIVPTGCGEILVNDVLGEYVKETLDVVKFF